MRRREGEQASKQASRPMVLKGKEEREGRIDDVKCAV